METHGGQILCKLELKVMCHPMNYENIKHSLLFKIKSIFTNCRLTVTRPAQSMNQQPGLGLYVLSQTHGYTFGSVAFGHLSIQYAQ